VKTDSHFQVPLRIGLWIDTWMVPYWVSWIAAEITASDSAVIVAVIVNQSESIRYRLLPNAASRPQKFIIPRFYSYLDHCIFRMPSDMLERVDFKETLTTSTVINTMALFDGPYFRFNEPDSTQLQALALDVLLLFGFGLPTVQVRSLAHYGVWSFLDHERLSMGYAPTGFWEVLEHRPVAVQDLRAHLADIPSPLLLHRLYGAVDLRSIRKTRHNLFAKSAAQILRKLDALYREGSLDALASIHQQDKAMVSPKTPSNLASLKAITSHIRRFVQDRRTYRRYIDQWIIGYTFATPKEGINRDFATYHWLVPPKGRSWADPFPACLGDQYFLFFEEFMQDKGQGHLCVAAVGEQGLQEEPQILLQCEYHVSYPFIFTWQGEWYMIPETKEANRIDLYKFDAFPYKITYYKTLMDHVSAVDTTLVEMDGRWWMFVTLAPAHTPHVDELFLFGAESPLGPWVPHPKQPIKSDVRSSRPAGNLFTRYGSYYRPAQDCSRTYGYGVRLQKILVLSATDYAEEEAEVLLPEWAPDIVQTHTLNIVGTITAIDAKKRRRL
jgi:hypothetical protein